MLREMWDFPGSAFKWLFLKQHESLDADACNSKATVGLDTDIPTKIIGSHANLFCQLYI